MFGNNQNLSVQVDTGSSDLWLASTACGSQACKQTNGQLYDPSQATSTNVGFTITYVEGYVSGTIVWDSVSLGGYTVGAQALAAAATVDSEPLAPAFDGVLGLALPANSVIENAVPGSFGNGPDGAVLPSNLFSITPVANAPNFRFLSLTLERPESAAVPSRLGIGRHPSGVAHPERVEYAPVWAGSSGAKWWQGSLADVTVYVDGVGKAVALGTSGVQALAGAPPTAVVDSGMPVILASVAIANAVYGALGVGPASDGQYYLPCTTPINMTITLDNRTALALHPLDLTTPTSSSACLGLIQAFPPSAPVAQIADLILGVPFMRSAYTVLAYDVPSSTGAFPSAARLTGSGAGAISPTLGLLGLTNASVALEEFHTVRVLNEPLSAAQPAGGGSGSGSSGKAVSSSSGHKLSVGIEVLIGLVGFVVLCAALFAARFLVQRRRMRRLGAAGGMGMGMGGAGSSGNLGGTGGGEGKDAYMLQDAAYALARRGSWGAGSRYGPSEETLRAKRYREYVRRSEIEMGVGGMGEGSMGGESARTRVGEEVGEGGDGEGKERRSGGMGGMGKGEGYEAVRRSDSEFGSMDGEGEAGDSPKFSMSTRRTLVDASPSPPLPPKELAFAQSPPYANAYPPSPPDPASPPLPSFATPLTHTHHRLPSGESASVAVPLLAHTRSDSHFSLTEGLSVSVSPPSTGPAAMSAGMAEMGMGMDMGTGGMAGVGSGRRASRARVGSIGAARAADEERRLSFSSVQSRSSGMVGALPRLGAGAGGGGGAGGGRVSSFGEVGGGAMQRVSSYGSQGSPSPRIPEGELLQPFASPPPQAQRLAPPPPPPPPASFAPHPSTHPHPHPHRHPQLVNLGVGDVSLVSLSAEASNGHGP
ncbi:hypothetical protein EIP86_000880 [Pleurotus ostreatoroseus]|nr:hypothetical protein EIP86_000880 [Pleurotus ostreatoroseus]